MKDPVKFTSWPGRGFECHPVEPLCASEVLQRLENWEEHHGVTPPCEVEVIVQLEGKLPLSEVGPWGLLRKKLLQAGLNIVRIQVRLHPGVPVRQPEVPDPLSRYNREDVILSCPTCR